MALALSASIVDKQNVLLTLNGDDSGAVVRLAALATDTLVTLTGVNPADQITWTLFLNPTWLTLEVDSVDHNIARVKFTNPSADVRMFQCYVQADDGTSKVRYPLAIEVLEPLSISISGRTDNYLANDFTSPDVTLSAKGLHDLPVTDGSVQFVTPVGLPAGLQFATGDGGTAKLVVMQPNSLSVSGGVIASAPTPYDFLAYRPGSMYDSLTYPFKQSVTVGTLADKKGTLNSGFTCVWDDTNGYLKLNILTDYLGGIGDDPEFVWVVSGTATGTVTAGGTAKVDYMNWTPTSAGTVQFDLSIKNSVTNNVMKTLSFGPVEISTEFPSGPGANWSGTSAIKLQADASYKSGAIGETVPLTISVPADDFTGPETITVSVVVTPLGGEPSIANPSSVPLTSGSNDHTFNLVIPANAPYRGKWGVAISATNGSTRTGKMELILLSSGKPQVSINNQAIIALSQIAGSSIQEVALVATNKGTLAEVPDVAFSLIGAPAGLTIVGNKIVGSVPQAGSYNFRVMGTHPNYAPSYTEASLVVTGADAPLAITSFTSDVSQIQDATQFHIHWGIVGTARTLVLQKNLEWPPTPVLGSVQSTQTINGTSVFTLVGTDYRTKVYSKPVIVVSSSTAGLTKLPGSPTIATIDKSNTLTLMWNPPAINDGYGLYRGWNIQTKKNGEAATQLLDPNTHLAPTGLADPAAKNDSRIFTTQLPAGEYAMNIYALSSDLNSILNSDPWATFLDFPTALDPSTVILDKTAVKLEESLTVELSQVYGGADTWRITYSDGTNTGWLPITQKTQSKLWHVPGSQTVIVDFEKDYSTLSPSVKLRRSVTLNVYVQNEVFNSSTVGIVGVGNIGLGGEKGFEIADLSKDSFAREPFEVVVKALVKDDMTQELKMMVATSRSNNASSVLNTMAADIFPLVGRPHLKDLVLPALNLNGDLSLIAPVEITTTALPDVSVGAPMPEVQLLAIGGTAPYDWFSDSLPFGLRLAVDGTLSGTPLQIGTYNINISVKDSTNPAFIAETSVTMVVKSSLLIDLTQPSDATVGTYYQHQLVCTGGLSPYYWTLADGSIPLGLTMDASTGLITGYPVSYNSDEDFDTPYSFIAEVMDSAGSRASGNFSINLLPMSLTLGNVDQPIISKGVDYKLAVPVFGGRSPYSVTAFSSDGSIGNNLAIIAPETVDAVSGLGTANLTIVTGDQVFSPAVYPFQATFPLAAVGGVAPYTWSLDTTNPSVNTVSAPVVSAATAGGQFSADGTQTINVHVTDSTGNSTSKVIRMVSTLHGGAGGTGETSLEYVTINKNGSTDVNNWTFTKISALPDAQQGATYRPSVSTFYGVAVWDPNTDSIYSLKTGSTQVQFKTLFNKVGGAGQGADSQLIIDAIPIPLSETNGGWYSGWYGGPVVNGINNTAILQALFTTTSGILTDPTTGLPFPSSWQDIYNRTISIHKPNLPPDQQVYTWAIGSRTTLPGNWRPSFSGTNVAGQNVTGATVTTATGMVELVHVDIPEINFPAMAVAQISPYILEITATDGAANTYSTMFNFYLAGGGYLQMVRAPLATTNTLQTRKVWPGMTTDVVSNQTMTTVGLDGSAISLAGSTSGTVTQSGASTPYFPMGVAYYQGDYLNRTRLEMKAGDTSAFPPTVGYHTTGNGQCPYTFLILNDTGTADANAKIGTVGNFNIGTVVTDNDLSKEMSVHCSVAGGGNTPVVTVTSTHGDVLDVSALGYRYRRILKTDPALLPATDVPVAADPIANPDVMIRTTDYVIDAVVDTGYVNWFYILNATGGQAPYTFAIEDGTTLPGVSVHNSQNTRSFLNVDGTNAGAASYQGSFLLIDRLPSAIGYSLYNNLDYVAKVTATDANGVKSVVATIPFRVVPQTTGVITASLGGVASSVLQATSNTLTGGTLYLGKAVDILNQAVTLSTNATWTIDTPLPAGLSFSNLGSGSIVNGSGSMYGRTAKLVGTPTGTPVTTNVTLTATAPGYAPFTQHVSITIAEQTAVVTVLNNGVARPNTTYSVASGSPLIKVSYNGFLPSETTSLTSNLGTVGQASITNVTDIHTAEYAQAFDVYYDFNSAGVTSGTGTLTLPGPNVTADFIVEAHPLTAAGKTVSFVASEYRTGVFGIAIAPLVISGGTTPHGAVCTTVSDTSHFGISNNQPYLNMASTTPGNTYTTNATYKVADSTLPNAQTVDAVATISVYVQPETFINVDFVNTTHTYSTGLAVDFPVVECIHAQLGHAPFQWRITSVTLSDGGMAAWVKFSPSNRVVIINNSANDVIYRDYADADTITSTWNGALSLSGRTGANFTIPKFVTPPVSGSYTIQFGITVIDVKGISTTGTAVMTLIVP